MEDEEYDLDKLPESFKTALLVIYIVVMVLGVSGNGVVIWVTGFKVKKTVNTTWYLNLAVADFLATAFLPMRIASTALSGHWPFGLAMCKINDFVFYMNMYTSVYILVVISVDRCVSVVRPVWARNHRSVRKASWVSLGVWALAMALSIHVLIFKDTRLAASSSSSNYTLYDNSSSNYNKILCYDNYAFVDDWSRRTAEEKRLQKSRYGVMSASRFLMGFLVPFTVIVSCYSVIVYRLKTNRALAGKSGRSFKIIAAVIGAFFLCWAPYHIMFLVEFVELLATEFSATLHVVIRSGLSITFGLALFNSALNPPLYVFTGQDFKDVFSSRRSVLKVLEKAFAEEVPPQTNTSTADPAITTTTEIALSDIIEGSTGDTKPTTIATEKA